MIGTKLKWWLILATSLSATVGLSACGAKNVINDFLSPDAPSAAPEVAPFVVPTLKTLAPLTGHAGEVAVIYPVVPTGQAAPEMVIAGDLSGLVILWDLKTGKAGELFKLPSSVSTLAISQDARYLAAVKPGAVTIHSLQDGRELYSLPTLRTRTAAIDFQPKQPVLLIGGADGRIYRWRFRDEKLAPTPAERERMLERYIAHGTVVSAVTYHPFGRVFFSADWRGGMNAWLSYDTDPFKGEYDRDLFGDIFYSDTAERAIAKRDNANGIDILRVTPNGEVLVVALQDGSVEAWRVRGFKKDSIIVAHHGLIYDMDISADGKEVVTAGRDGRVKLWTLAKAPPSDGADPIFMLTLLKEISVPDVRRAKLVSPGRVVAGRIGGQLLDIKIN